MKQFNFDLQVASNALLCPNPSEWYDRAYLGSNVAGNYKLIPGVKNSTKVAANVFGSTLAAADCVFSPANTQLSATTMSVCDLKANTSVCKTDLESSFVSNEMAAGSQNYTVENFMSHYWDTMNKKIQEEIEGIRWRGNTATASYSGATAYLKLCDGYEKKLLADSNVIDVTLTAITTSNVINAMSTVVAAAPAAIKGALKSELRLYVASNVYLAFQIATSNLFLNTPNTTPTFAGIPVVEAPGMTDSKMVFTHKDNLVYLFDGEGDAENLVAIDAFKSMGIPVIYTVALLKIGFGILNPDQIVYFN